CARKEDSLDIW
nr:immunoglobulin heavy chain junction region [Macaca mulatta]MOV87254.1 immunoglobulin heavy chain junction region [Macaca mulatta]MOV91895.1 immunoglobulin heavy chain junction region [Macaca mulatta]MOY23770.1 immunoglobulin heavy chain junction region [Macaca mulatta]